MGALGMIFETFNIYMGNFSLNTCIITVPDV